jgi:transient receptor potential cation channel subfamily A protein 1
VLNKVNALQVMSKYQNVIDIQQGGEHGRTALHLAALHDHEECARILVNKIVENLKYALIHCGN